MLTLRPADERGRGWHGWLDSRHSFSFADYYDPEQMGFRALRVINEDWVQGGHGFPLHPHRDMEIITWVVGGSVRHQDTTGTSGTVGVDEAQRMTAGRGIYHSEVNPSPTEPLHLFQIWLLPDRRGLAPGYADGRFPKALRAGRLALLASADGRDGSLSMATDTDLWVGRLAGAPLTHRLADGRGGWVQVVAGSLTVNGTAMGPGDGLAVEHEAALAFDGAPETEFLLFDLA